MNDSTDVDVLDAVTLELSRFTRDVVVEVHRLRDELIVERRRTDQLESTVQSLTASLRKFDTQAAGIVEHVIKLSAEVDRRLADVVCGRDPAATSTAAPDDARLSSPIVAATPPPLAEADQTKPEDVADDLLIGVSGGVGVHADDDICFAPLTLTLDPVEVVTPHDTSIDDLVARVVGAIVDPPQRSGTIDRAHDLVEPTST